MLIAGSSSTGDVLREITAECGFEVDEEGAAVIDHLNYDARDQGKVIIKQSDYLNWKGFPSIKKINDSFAAHSDCG